MIQLNSIDLLRQLATDVTAIAHSAATFDQLSSRQLTQQPSPGQWSVAQCLEHLNTYGRYYLPRLDEAISKAENRPISAASLFKSSWLGNYFVAMMQPPAAGQSAKRYKAARQHRPATDLDPHAVQTEFQHQQRQLLDLLSRAEKIDLRQSAVALSIARWLSLNMGDVLRFLVAHEQRHMAQAHRIIALLNSESVATSV